MPYGMPNETPEIIGKMERCVKKVMAQGKPKVNAIRICKSSMLKGMAVSKKLSKKE